ncbi:prolyl oligopeptidase family serine peptidase [Gluconobacter oxydans]|uniref:S9 family peptidase n=1 Tax=Gluconobacter oxydans TaxID=442 RepID=UPI0039E90441
MTTANRLPDRTASSTKRVLQHALSNAAICGMLATVLTAPAAFGKTDTGVEEISPRDIASLRSVADAQISPDGKTIVYERVDPSKKDAPTPPLLWEVATDGHHPAIRFPGTRPGDHEAHWSPAANMLALLRNTARPGEPELVLAKPGQATVTHVLGMKGSPVTYRWSQDGRSIAIITREKPASPSPAGQVEGVSGASHLFILDLTQMKVREVPVFAPFIFDVDWAPDSQRLILRTGQEGGLDYFWYRSKVSVISTAGKLLQSLPGHATAVHPSFSPDGHQLVYGYFAEDGIGGRVARYDLQTGTRHLLGNDWGGAILRAIWDQDGKGLTVLGFKGVDTALAHVSTTDDRLEPFATLQGEIFDFSEDHAGNIAVVASTRQQPGEVWLYHGANGRMLTQTNPEVSHWNLGEQRTVHWKGRDGLELEGILVLPPNAPSRKPLPLFVQVHGGPLEAWYDGWLGSWHNWARMLASHGIAVFMPNPRGSEGGNAAFAVANRGDWGGQDYQDILSGVDMLEQSGIADPGHLALGGWSYGGFMGMWAAGHNDRFRTIIAGAGISDLESMAVATDVGFSFISPYFGDPLTHRAEYAAHSPLSFARAVTVPVLLLHGNADARVPPVQSRMFYAALHEQGKPVRLVHYQAAPHWFGGSVGMDTEIDVQQQVLSWLQHYL